MRTILTILCIVCGARLLSAETYYVSAGGSDAALGTSEQQALASVGEAASRVEAGDTVLLRRGDVFRESVSFTQTGLTIAAYGDPSAHRPVISGSVPITGWVRHQGNIYRAETNSQIEYLYADNQFVWSARWPNAGASPAPFCRAAGYTRISNGYTIRSRHLTTNPRDADGYWTGARLRWRRWNWWYETRPITNYTTANGTGTITALGGSSYWDKPSAPVGFYIDNKLSELDTANEWYQDPSTRTVYLWAPGDIDPNTIAVEGTVRSRGLTINAGRVLDICFRQLKGPGLSITGTSTVDRCLFENIGGEHGGEGLRAESGTRNARVTNCSFREMLNIAIHWLENATGSSSLIEKDTLRHVGIRPAYGSRMGTWHEKKTNVHYSGIAVSYGNNVRIRHCDIDSTGYAGINLHDDNNTVEFNLIRHAMATLNDGGGIYCLTNGSTFRRNIILNTIGEIWAGSGGGTPGSNISHGLWLEFLHGYRDNTVVGNTMAYNPKHGFWLPRNYTTTVRGNVCFGNADAQMRVDTRNRSLIDQHHTIEDNVFYSTALGQTAFSHEAGLDFGSMNGNYYCNPFTDSVMGEPPAYQSIEDWNARFPEVADPAARTDPMKRPAQASPDDPSGMPKLLYNASPSTRVVPIGDNGIYLDLDGNEVRGSVTLEPYASVVLVHTGRSASATVPADRLRTDARFVVRRQSGGVVAQLEGLPGGSTVELVINDLRGRAVVRRTLRVPADGRCLLRWGEHSHGGSAPAPGLYRWHVTVSAAGSTRTFSTTVCRL